MISAVTWSVVWLCWAAAAIALVLCLIGRAPSDFSVGLLALCLLGVLVLGVVALVSVLSGSGSVGDGLDWVGYWVSCLIVGVGAGLWAVLQRNRWGTLVLAIALLTLGVMVVRMEQVWFGSGWVL